MAQALTAKKKIALAGLTVLICTLFLEVAFNTLTLVGLLPVNDVLSPWFYKESLQRTTGAFDEYGSPIRISGYGVYTNRELIGPPIAFDERGYRPADSARFDSTRYKIGIFGDSYTDGLQVRDSETFPRVLERLLEADAQDDLDIYNFGVGGTGTYHQFLRYLTVSEDVDLDLVLLALMPQNDILNNYRPLGKDFELPGSPYYGGDAGAQEQGPDPNKARLRRFVKSIFNWTVGSTFTGRAIFYGPTVFKHRVLGAGMAAGWFPKSERASWLGVYGEPVGHWPEAWRVTEEIILKFAAAARERKDEFAMVIVADSLQIHNLLGERMFDQEYDFTFPNRRLMKFCESHGLTCYDSLPFFLETAKTLKLKPPFFAWKYDGHYAQIGHTTMGEYLNSRLRSLPHFAAAK